MTRHLRAILLASVSWVLSGCDSPSTSFRGLPAHRVTIDGATFSVRHTPHAAETIRLGTAPPSGRGTTVAKGLIAIERVTGCDIRKSTVRGDAAIVVADLDCGDAERPRLRPTTGLDCGVIPGIFDPDDLAGATIDCVAIRQ